MQGTKWLTGKHRLQYVQETQLNSLKDFMNAQ